MTRSAKFTGKRIYVSLTPKLAASIAKLVNEWGTSEAHVARRLMEKALEAPTRKRS